MPLPTNYSRPTLPYDPLQSLPNDQRFALLTTLQQSPTAEMFDAEFNAVIDKMNTLADAINNVVAGSIPGSDNPLNAGKFLVTDGAGNLSFIMVGSDNISPNTITTALLQDQAVTRAKIGDGAVGSTQLAEACVTATQLAEGAVTPNKIPVGSLPLSKFIKPTTASVIGGTTTGGGSWYELTMGDYQIASKKPQNNGVTAVSLAEVWSGTNGNFDGAKITASSLVLGQLISGQQSCLLAGTGTNNAYYEVPMGDWQIAVKRAQDNAPTGRTLDIIWSNTVATFDGLKITPGSLTGTQIKDNSLDQKKINNYKQFVPFCMGSMNADKSLTKSLNVQGITKNGTGLYRIAFVTAASSNDYVCLPVVNDGGGATAVTYDKSTQAVVVRVMNLQGQNVDRGFDFEIKDW